MIVDITLITSVNNSYNCYVSLSDLNVSFHIFLLRKWQILRLNYLSFHLLLVICSPKCVNGGSCIGLNTCLCSNEYSGAFCQRSKQHEWKQCLLTNQISTI